MLVRYASFFAIVLCLVFIQTGCKEFFYPEQKPGPKDESTIDDTGTGLKVTKRADGSVVSKVPYKNGERHGKGVSFYPSGEKQLEINYLHGKKHGLEHYYYESGAPYRITRFNEGKRDSTQVFYHKNGKLMAKVPYKNGILCAGTEEYKDTGEKLKPAEILIQTNDQVALNSTYSIELSLSRRMRQVEFIHFEDGEDLTCPSLRYPVPTEKGKTAFVITIPKGQFLMEEKVFGAECTSYQRVKHLVIKRVAINATNRA